MEKVNIHGLLTDKLIIRVKPMEFMLLFIEIVLKLIVGFFVLSIICGDKR